MATKDYWVRFGSGHPTLFSGLSPTFIVFINSAGGATTPPGITEPGAKGLYRFTYEPQGSIAFIIDAATTGVADSSRYVVGNLDIADRIDEFIGRSTDGIGSSSADPTTMFGFLKRAQEAIEGDSTYTKNTGVFVIKDRTGATTLASKTISDSGTVISKT